MTAKRRRDDGPWRNACIAEYGDSCRNCGRYGCQMDHMVARSQGGPSVVPNGLPLCPPCHAAKTAGTLRIQLEWLTAEQVAWLAAGGPEGPHAVWDPVTGVVSGRHTKVFADDRRKCGQRETPAVGV